MFSVVASERHTLLWLPGNSYMNHILLIVCRVFFFAFQSLCFRLIFREEEKIMRIKQNDDQVVINLEIIHVCLNYLHTAQTKMNHCGSRSESLTEN